MHCLHGAFKQLVFILMVLYFLVPVCLSAQNSSVNNEYSLLFYNTENFFDVENDSTANDEDFLLNAKRNWNRARFYLKTEHLAKVILATGKWNAPLLVGLCEIENREVLETLVRAEPLSKYQYKIIQKDSPDLRGIDVALLYRPDFFRPLNYEALRVSDPENKNFRTRDILKVEGILNDCDTIVMFVNHWPSRFGGVMETEKYRNLAAQTLRQAIDRCFSNNPKAKINCMGDFNDTPSDGSLQTVAGENTFNTSAASKHLINLSSEWASAHIQTIKNKFQWQTFDQIMVSEGVSHPTSCMTNGRAEIFSAGFLLEKDVKYGGLKPRRTYVGFKYNNGFSDHLPVVFRFSFVKN